MSEEWKIIRTEKELLFETIHCLNMGYEVSPDIIETVHNNCLLEEDYESLGVIKQIYEMRFGKGTYNFN